MYTQYFSLTQDPFSIAPDPRFLFMSERHREALAHLLYGVTGPNQSAAGMGGGFVLLTGDIGAGKTTICRCFLEQIPAACHVAYIVNPKLNVVELLQTICDEFHISVSGAGASPKACIDALNAFLLQAHANGQGCVLIVDEAQNLAADVLEQLRLLTNLETNERKLLQIVLIGQPELRTMLATPGLEQLAQRVIARFHLEALDHKETRQYIEHRLGVAGHKGDLPFDARALKRIFHLTRGVPRRVNLLCGRALLGAWANGQARVDKAVVDRASTEVFGPDLTNRPGWMARHKTTVASAVVLLLATSAIGGFLLWRSENNRVLAAIHSAQAEAAAQAAAKVKADATALPASHPASSELAMTHQPSAAPAVEQRTHEDVASLLPKLPRDINSAWLELARVWQLPPLQGTPCTANELKPWQCHQVGKLTLPQLRQLGRPGVLTLVASNDTPVYAVLVGLSEHTATVQIDGQQSRIDTLALGKLWQGDFSTYWTPPAGYKPGLNGSRGAPVLAELARQLALLEGAPAPTAPASAAVLDADLKQRVRAFQLAQGLASDGLPGPLTFMQIERARGLTKPSLLTEPR
jgi:general secretion pathway protein A